MPMESFYNITDILKNTFNSLITQFIDFVPRIIGCVLVLLIGYFVANFIRAIVRNILGRVGFDRIGERLNQIG
jgi:flagellar biosynthesis protein FliQ